MFSFCRSTEGFADKTPSEQFDLYVKALREVFEEPKNSKCRRLASELSAMVQDRSESIDQFAFKYKNVYTNWTNKARKSLKLVPLTSPCSLSRSYSCTLLCISFSTRIKLFTLIKPSKLHAASDNPSPHPHLNCQLHTYQGLRLRTGNPNVQLF